MCVQLNKEVYVIRNYLQLVHETCGLKTISIYIPILTYVHHDQMTYYMYCCTVTNGPDCDVPMTIIMHNPSCLLASPKHLLLLYQP